MASFAPRAATMGRVDLPYFDPSDPLPMRDQTMTPAPSFAPFRFEPKRARIDWRLLHGVDIDTIIRDIDLDTLEKIVSIVAYGDIEAEDTRHLTELNFIKVFRMAQLMIEYLLYVQDCLQSTNAWLQHDRSSLEKYIQAARMRVRELDAHLKMSKRELRRARKTAKTYELMVTMGKLGDNDKKQSDTSPGPGPAPAQSQVIKIEQPVNTAMETLLRKELSVLAERLTKAQIECQQLRIDREEMYSQIKEIDAAVRRGYSSNLVSPKANPDAAEVRSLRDQLQRANQEIRWLKADKDEVQAAKKGLEEEKEKLLHELAHRPTGDIAVGDNSNLGKMLFDAEARNRDMEGEVEAKKQAINALQKELMKAMKEAAKNARGPGSEDVQKLQAAETAKQELQQRVEQLERELADRRRLHNEDVRDLQGELEATQQHCAELERRVAQLQAGQASQQAVTMAVRPKTRLSATPDGSPQRQPTSAGNDALEGEIARMQSKVGEYEVMLDQQNQQVKQLRGERGQLHTEMDRLRQELDKAYNSLQKSPAPDSAIERDWKLEEIDRLRDENASLNQRVAGLEEAVQLREGELSRLRQLVKDLQAQLALSPAARDSSALGRVKQQVEEFERIGYGQASPSEALQGSFKFKPAALQTPQGPGIQSEVTTPAVTPPQQSNAVSSPPPPPSAAAQAASPPSPRVAPVPYVPVRPALAQAAAMRQHIMTPLVGLTPANISQMIEQDLRVITENPFEYEEDDEEQFRAVLPHDLQDKQGVLSIKPHTMQELGYALQRYAPAMLGKLDDEVASFGLNPEVGRLTDSEYAAAMLELASRRQSRLSGLPQETQERMDVFRDALLTHLELVKRNTLAEKGKEALAVPDSTLLYNFQSFTTAGLHAGSPSSTPNRAGSGHLDSQIANVTLGGGRLAGPAAAAGRPAAVAVAEAAHTGGKGMVQAGAEQGMSASLPAPSFPSSQPITGPVPAVAPQVMQVRTLNMGQSAAPAQQGAAWRSPGDSSTTSPMNMSLNQSVPGPQRVNSSGHSLNQTGSGSAAATPGKSIMANVAAMGSSMNTSLRSTGKASVRDYAANDFDDSSSDDAGRNQEKASDEYDLSGDDEFDEGVMDLPEASFNKPSIISAGKSPEKPTATQSRLSRTSSVNEGNRSELPPRPSAAKPAGSWTEAALDAVIPASSLSAGVPQDVEQESVQSFNMMDSTRSNFLASQKAQPKQPGAWGSPDASIRTARAGNEQQGLPGTGRWSEALQSLGSIRGSARDNEIQAFGEGMSDASQSPSHDKPLPLRQRAAMLSGQHYAGGQGRLAAEDSVETISEVDYY